MLTVLLSNKTPTRQVCRLQTHEGLKQAEIDRSIQGDPVYGKILISYHIKHPGKFELD